MNKKELAQYLKKRDKIENIKQYRCMVNLLAGLKNSKNKKMKAYKVFSLTIVISLLAVVLLGYVTSKSPDSKGTEMTFVCQSSDPALVIYTCINDFKKVAPTFLNSHVLTYYFTWTSQSKTQEDQDHLTDEILKILKSKGFEEEQDTLDADIRVRIGHEQISGYFYTFVVFANNKQERIDRKL